MTTYQRRRRNILARGRAFVRRAYIPRGIAGYAASMIASGAVRRVGGLALRTRKRQNPLNITPAAKILKLRREGESQKKIVGFNIIRQKLMNHGFDDTNASFDACKGVGPVLKSEFYNTLFSNSTVLAPTTTAVPGTVHNWRPLIICPQWVGSELTGFGSVLCGAGENVLPRFGVINNNTNAMTDTLQPSNNYQFNLNVISGMYPFLTDNTELSANQIDYTGNTIRVYNSFLTFRFTNQKTQRRTVYLFKFKFRDQKFENGAGTCEAIDDMKVEKILNNLAAVEGENPGGMVNKNMNTIALMNLIRKGKLPSKLFKVYACKKVTLGANAYNDAYLRDNIPHTKLVKMKFGQTAFRRSTCSNHYDKFTSEPLKARRQQMMHVMAICLPYYDCLEGGVSTTSERTAGVSYEVTKTNIFKVTEN